MSHDQAKPSLSEGATATGYRGDPRWAALVTALFFLVLGAGILTHEMWRDEWQAWMLARDSANPIELIRNLRYEGHPPGWYLLLWVITRFTRNVMAMQVLHLLIATGSVYLLTRYAPLPRSYRLLIAFGYFFLYEYGVISRSYALGVLALFAFCALFPKRRQHPVAVTWTLLVLSSAIVYGMIIAIAIGIVLLGEYVYMRFREGHWKLPQPSVMLGAVVSVALVGLLVLQIAPPPDAGFFGRPTNTNPNLTRQDLLPLIRIWESYMPIPRFTEDMMWSKNLIPRSAGLPALLPMLVLSVAILTGGLLIFLRKPLVASLYVVGTAGLLLFSHLIHAGTVRHDGYDYILFVACLWLLFLPVREIRLPTRLQRWTDPDAWPVRAFLTTIFAGQIIAAAVMYVTDLRGPFTPVEDVARFLKEEGLADGPIAVSGAPETSHLAGLLDRPLYHLDTGTYWTFVRWNHMREPQSREKRLERLREFLMDEGREVIAVLNWRHDAWDPDIVATELAHFDLAQADGERYFVYRVTRVVPEAAPEGL